MFARHPPLGQVQSELRVLLELLPQLCVLLLAHELDQLPLSLELLLDRPEITNLLLGSVLELLEMLSSVLLGLKSIEKLECKRCFRILSLLVLSGN